MTTEPIYNLALQPYDQKIAPGVVSGVGWAMPGGMPYLDTFARNSAPSPRQVIHECLGLAWTCSNLNATSMASTKIRLYLRSHRSASDSRNPYIRAYEQRNPGRTCAKIIDPARNLKHPLVKRDRHQNGLKIGGSPVVGFGSDEQTVVTEITDHPLLQLLTTPEPLGQDVGLTGSAHRWATHMYLQTLGRSYWLLDGWKMGVPTKMWLLHSQYVTEVPHEKGIRFIDSYEYGSGADKQNFGPDQVIKFAHQDLAHLRMGGFSRFFAAMEAHNLLRKDDAHLNALLENGGFPMAAFVPKGDETGNAFISPENAARIRGAFNREFRQAGAGGIAVLNIPGALQNLAWKPTELVDDKRREVMIQNVADCFGVPMALLKLNESNLTSADAASYQYAKYTIMPEAVDFEETLNTQLKPLFPGTEDMFLAFDNPVPDDKSFELEMSRNAWEQGLLEVNEARSAFGQPPLDGPAGNMRYMTRGNVPIDNATGLPMITPQDTKKNPDLEGASAVDKDGKPVKKPDKKSSAKRAALLDAGYDEDEVSEIMNNDTKKILRQLARAVKMLAQQKESDVEYRNSLQRRQDSGNLGQGSNDVERANGGGRERPEEPDQNRLRARGILRANRYSEAETEAALNRRRNGHVHATL